MVRYGQEKILESLGGTIMVERVGPLLSVA